jgi:hypothetical protein
LASPEPRHRGAARLPRPEPEAAVELLLAAPGVVFLLAQQRLAVGDRDLVVVGMNFAEGQEAMAVAAIVHERGLQRRLDARHLGQIDVALQLSAVRRLVVELLNAASANHHHPGFFRVGGVD